MTRWRCQQASDLVYVEQAFELAVAGMPAQVIGNTKLHALFTTGVSNGDGVVKRCRHGFFQQHMLAGLPASVVERARVVLDMLEKGEREGGGASKIMIDDLPLFAAAPAPTPGPAKSPLQDMLNDIHPDDLTPRAALDWIYKLKDASKN